MYLNPEKLKLPKVRKIDGVPGCGKTTTVLEKHERNKDLVLTATTAARKEYLSKVSHPNRDYYRTYDSVLINGAPKVKRIWCDEGLMVHAGDIYIIATMCQAEEVIILGDTNQIPFISRVIGYECQHNKIAADHVEHHRDTHRLTKSTVNLLKDLYPEGIYSKSEIKGTEEVIHVEFPVKTMLDDVQLVMTFT
jgi:hypothetical protein